MIKDRWQQRGEETKSELLGVAFAVCFISPVGDTLGGGFKKNKEMRVMKKEAVSGPHKKKLQKADFEKA